jgi:hypothetical protein
MKKAPERRGDAGAGGGLEAGAATLAVATGGAGVSTAGAAAGGG